MVKTLRKNGACLSEGGEAFAQAKSGREPGSKECGEGYWRKQNGKSGRLERKGSGEDDVQAMFMGEGEIRESRIRKR